MINTQSPLNLLWLWFCSKTTVYFFQVMTHPFDIMKTRRRTKEEVTRANERVSESKIETVEPHNAQVLRLSIGQFWYFCWSHWVIYLLFAKRPSSWNIKLNSIFVLLSFVCPCIMHTYTLEMAFKRPMHHGISLQNTVWRKGKENKLYAVLRAAAVAASKQCDRHSMNKICNQSSAKTLPNRPEPYCSNEKKNVITNSSMVWISVVRFSCAFSFANE